MCVVGNKNIKNNHLCIPKFITYAIEGEYRTFPVWGNKLFKR